MLVLSRKLDEKIMIDGGITITVVNISHGKVHLGIEAPKETKILRQEKTPPHAYTRPNRDSK